MNRTQIEPRMSTYLHAKGGKLGLSVGGTFELTARCNFDCPMCYVHLAQATPEQELTAEQWISLASRAKEKGMMFALLTGGEPFIRKDFFEIFDALKAMGLLVSINSNGSMLNGEIRRRLIENPPFRMNISLYGGCRETYRKMCGKDAFDQVIENLRALKAAGIDVRLNVSVTPYNRQDIRKIFEISREMDVPVKATGYMYPPIRVGGSFGGGNRMSPEEAAAFAVEWDSLRLSEAEFSQRAKALHGLQAIAAGECGADPDEGVSCRAGRSSFWITWDGRMLPCGMMPGPVARPLDIGFDDAWEQIRSETQQIRMPKECGTCPKRPVCPVCAAVCVTETGAFDGVPEYMCRMTEATIQKTWQCHCQRSKNCED